MKTILFTICILLPFLSYSQKDSVNKVMFSVGIYGSPDYCYRKLDFYGTYIDYKDQWKQVRKNDTESSIIGYATGIGLKLTFLRRIMIETGTYFTKRGYQAKRQPRENFEHLYISGFKEPCFEYSYSNYFNFLEIPLKAGMSLIDRRMKLYVFLGVAFEYLLNSEQTYKRKYSNGYESINRLHKNGDFIETNVASLAGAGVSYDITKHVLISLEPTYTSFINSILVHNYGPQEYLYAVSGKVGVSYRF